MSSTAAARQNPLSSGDEIPMSETLAIAVARLEEKMDAVKEVIDENVVERKANTDRLASLERQQERHADTTAGVLKEINRQLVDFIFDAKRQTSESAEKISTLAGRLKPLEDDLRIRLEKESEDRRRTAESDRHVRRLRNGVGLIAGAAGGIYAAKDSLHTFLKWLVKAAP